MQNNVTYLSRKLQRSLDNNYNVIDMPAVIEIISTLEKTSVTKELLETTRLGKYINELRRKTSNESLAKRAKELLKKWRDLILPDANGQIRSTEAPRSDSPKNHSKKRPASSSSSTTPPDNTTRTTSSMSSSSSSKKMLININNGQNNREYDFSDNSNCSVKELKKTDVIFINSDSNSSMPESIHPGDHHFEVSNDATDNNTDASASSMQPKKRGRKKGSKNHKNLVIAAEESFTNKMAVSRNSKVKTTQELLADIQNRKPTSQDIELRTAQLTESLSRIEHKLNPQKTINKTNKNDPKLVNKTTTQFPVVDGRSSPDPITLASDDEIVDVVGTDQPPETIFKQEQIVRSPNTLTLPTSQQPLTIDNLLKQLPPIDKSCLNEPDEIPICVCPTPKVTEINHQLMEQQQEKITVQIVGDSAAAAASSSKESLFAPPSPPFFSDTTTPSSVDNERTSDNNNDVLESVNNENSDSCDENLLCPAKLFLAEKYHLDAVDGGGTKVADLHDKYLPNVNGNFGLQSAGAAPVQPQKNSDDVENIVPNYMSERLHKTPNENFQKYSISINDDDNDDDDGDGDDSARENRRRRNSCDSDNVRTAGDDGQTRNTDFREWHETLDVISYNDELLRILPYVIID